jgi:hypothetical protein
MRKLVLVGAVLLGIVAGAALGAVAQGPGGPDGLVTEPVEPGVQRVIRDGAGHDFDQKHPTYRYDMDNVVATPDGRVWLWATYSREETRPTQPVVLRGHSGSRAPSIPVGAGVASVSAAGSPA